jgi:hypothetical protein
MWPRKSFCTMIAALSGSIALSPPRSSRFSYNKQTHRHPCHQRQSYASAAARLAESVRARAGPCSVFARRRERDAAALGHGEQMRKGRAEGANRSNRHKRPPLPRLRSLRGYPTQQPTCRRQHATRNVRQPTANGQHSVGTRACHVVAVDLVASTRAPLPTAFVDLDDPNRLADPNMEQGRAALAPNMPPHPIATAAQDMHARHRPNANATAGRRCAGSDAPQSERALSLETAARSHCHQRVQRATHSMDHARRSRRSATS